MKTKVLLLALALLSLAPSACGGDKTTITQPPADGAPVSPELTQPLPTATPFPWFNGELNGIRFLPDSSNYRPQNICAELGLLDEWRQSADNALVHQLARGTRMEIVVDPAALPPGAVEVPVDELGDFTHKKCGQHVAQIQRHWRTPTAFIQVVKQEGTPVVPFGVPAPLLEAITVNSKRAVLERSIGYMWEESSMRLFIAEDFGLTIISVSGSGVRLAGLFKLVQGMQ
ncbi:MAG TPA: hypothetical protein VNL15_06835 [Dehalococcoidia bacterium]|nr:hypothetical protein [Dehalococcoidia bacterium]